MAKLEIGCRIKLTDKINAWVIGKNRKAIIWNDGQPEIITVRLHEQEYCTIYGVTDSLQNGMLWIEKDVIND